MPSDAAKNLKALHIPSSPIIFANIWDISSANALISLNNDKAQKPVKAVATASWAIAAALGIKDEDLTMEQNLDAILKVAPICDKAGLPLSVDIQDGYGDNIDAVVAAVVMAGAAGANIEDSIPSAGFSRGIAGSLYGIDEQVRRLKSALKSARDAGCPEFALNARCDVFRLNTSAGLSDEVRMKEAVSRGKAYLAAGATTVFFFGGSQRGLSKAEVDNLVKELGGKVAVMLREGPSALTAAELARIGVARISVGPSLYLKAMEAMKKSALGVLEGGALTT